jgi:tRNA 2-thiouridine synthesizing protein A
VWFYHGTSRAAAETGAPERDTASTILDVRGLEPPEPLVRILEALERLRPGERLEVLHERRPMFLYPQLDERGFAHETDEPEPGVVRILIRQGAAEA